MYVVAEFTDMIFIHFCELLLMFVSCVHNLFFKGRMESKISEANTLIFIFGWCEHVLMGISSF